MKLVTETTKTLARKPKLVVKIPRPRAEDLVDAQGRQYATVAYRPALNGETVFSTVDSSRGLNGIKVKDHDTVSPYWILEQIN